MEERNVAPGAEQVWPPSGSERSGDGRARRSQTARAWPRAAQHELVACLNRAVISKSTLKIKFALLLRCRVDALKKHILED